MFWENVVNWSFDFSLQEVWIMFKIFCGMFIICRLSGRKENKAYCFKNEHEFLEKGMIKMNYPENFLWPQAKEEP